MHNVIVGFTISPQPIDLSTIDVFSVGFTIHTWQHAGLYIAVWGIGDIKACQVQPHVWSLGFPAHTSLDDRNVLITQQPNGFSVSTDWLASIPVFYNTETGAVSTLSLQVTSPAHELDPEGTYSFIDFGYAILGRTFAKHIRMLPHTSDILVQYNNSQKIAKVEVQTRNDNVIELLQTTSSESQAVLQRIQEYITSREEHTAGTIIVPTSGGYDSRLLNSMVQDRRRIKAFTYGISDVQSHSSEVVKAKIVAQTLQLDWQHIPLGMFNSYYKQWYALFGPSTHLHGMYHIEFYTHIQKHIGSSATWLSGIIGDGWSGSVHIPEIHTPADLAAIGYTHGMRIDPASLDLQPIYTDRHEFIEQHRVALQHPLFRIVTAMRFKMVLLHYLVTIPQYMGYPTWTPFLNKTTAIAMLTLPESDRNNRAWQKTYFAKRNLDIESAELDFDKYNSLNAQGAKQYPLPNITAARLQALTKSETVEAYRNAYTYFIQHPLRIPWQNRILGWRIIGEIARRLGVKRVDTSTPYNAIVILKAIELYINHEDA